MPLGTIRPPAAKGRRTGGPLEVSGVHWASALRPGLPRLEGRTSRFTRARSSGGRRARSVGKKLWVYRLRRLRTCGSRLDGNGSPGSRDADRCRRRWLEVTPGRVRVAPPSFLRPRAAVVVTGSELVARRAHRQRAVPRARGARARPRAGADHGRRRPARTELEPALREAMRPTSAWSAGRSGADPRRPHGRALARVAGRALVVDEALEAEIEGVSRALRGAAAAAVRRLRGGRPQAGALPEGALVLGLAGTAPGLVARAGRRCVVVVLPGPPRELQRLWRTRSRREPVRRVLARAHAAAAARRCASSAPASRPSRARSPRRAATATASRRRSARATSRSRSTSSSSPAPRSARTRSRAPCVPPLERHLFARDERPGRGARARRSAARAGSRSRLPSRAPAGWSRRGLTVGARLERRVRRRRRRVRGRRQADRAGRAERDC